MADVTFTVSTGFLTRMRAAIVAENPALAGQTNAVINEAARVKARQLIRDWVNRHELVSSATSAQSGVVYPTDSDIT